MKKIIYLMSMMTLALVLVACGEDVTIGVPTNVRIENETILVWDAVEGADGYVVKVGDQLIEDISTTQQDLSVLFDTLEDGTYQASVASTLVDLTSEYSLSVAFVVDTSLDTVSNIVFDENTLTWNEAEDATSYRVVLLGESYSVTTNTFDLSALSLDPSDQMSVQVIAVYGTELSNPVSYSFDYSLGGMDAKTFMLKSVNDSFALNLTETDFDIDDDYEMYASASAMIDYYMDYAGDADETDAAKMFKMAVSLESTDVEDPFVIFEMFEDVDTMDGASVATLFMSFLLATNAMNQEQYETYIDELEVDLMTYETTLNATYETGVVSELEGYLLDYMDQITFDTWFTISENSVPDFYTLTSVMFNAYYELDNGYEVSPPFDLSYSYIQSIVESAFNASDAEFIAFFTDENYNALIRHAEDVYSYENALFQIESYENRLNDPLFETLEMERESFEVALSTLVDYVMDVRASIEAPLNKIEAMLESGTYTNEQIANVIGQIVYGIYENLPEEEMLDDAFVALMSVAYSELGMTELNATADAEIVVDQILVMMEAFAEFMYGIDADDVGEALTIVDELMVAETTDQQLLDILVLGARLVLEFEEANPSLVFKLRELGVNILDISLVDMIVGEMFDVDKVTAFIQAFDNVSHPLLRAYMNEFVTTDALLLREFATLATSQEEMPALDALVSALLPYVRMTNANLISEQTDALLDALITLVAPIVAVEFDLTETDILGLKDRVLTDVTVALYSVLSLSELIIETVDTMGLDARLTNEEEAIFELFKILDAVFEDEAFATIKADLLSSVENVLSDTLILSETQMTAEEVTSTLDEIEAFVDAFIADINIAANVDPQNPTDEEMDVVSGLFELLDMLVGSLNPDSEPNHDVYYDEMIDVLIVYNYSDETLTFDYEYFNSEGTLDSGQEDVSGGFSDTLIPFFDTSVGFELTVDVYDSNGNSVGSYYFFFG